MIKFFTIPGYARIKPNLTPVKEQVVLQSLNGKAVIGSLLLSELKMNDTVVKDYDGTPSAGQDVYLEMTDDGKVKASGIDRSEIPTEHIDCLDLSPDALEAIRRFNLTEGGGVLNTQGDQRVPIEKAGGRGFLTDTMTKTVRNATKDMTVADHISSGSIWKATVASNVRSMFPVPLAESASLQIICSIRSTPQVHRMCSSGSILEIPA